MKSLYAKLSAALLALIVLLGVGFFIVERFSNDLYHQELTQRLNSPLAMYVVGERQLISAGIVNESALHELAQQAMVINPTVEIYLLDTGGKIIGHALPDGYVVRDSVDLTPINELLSGNVSLPLKGDDPGNLRSNKIFSAAEVRSGQQLEGYLYAILGGAKYDALASDLIGSHVRRVSIVAIGVIGFGAFAIGLLLFAVLTQRLRFLTRAVQKFTASDFDPAQAVTYPARAGDEIDQLGGTFNAMSERIREQVESLKENDRLRRELISNVSHDLRTPLAAMQGYVETLLIKNDTLDAGQRQTFLEIARKHGQQLGGLIGDLFELSKLDSNSITPSFEQFSLAELLQDIIQEFQLEAQRKSIHLQLHDGTSPVLVYADIRLIQRVLENLVKNALKFTPAGGTVAVSISSKPTHIAVAVEDTGHGIAATDIPRIFDRFYRAEKGEESRSNSAGLGLAIVKRILDLHGSRISVTSTPEVGTRFEFDLPTERRAA